MDIVITPMVTEADIKGKAHVHWKSWHETYRDLVDASYNDNMTLETCERVARKWPGNHLVAKDGDRVIGFVAYGVCRDEGLEDCGEITALYLLAQYHDRKIGRALLDSALRKLSDYNRIVVWVLRGNERAVRFYEKCGFRMDGTWEEIILGKPNMRLRMIRGEEASSEGGEK